MFQAITKVGFWAYCYQLGYYMALENLQETVLLMAGMKRILHVMNCDYAF